jgi:hypothetical protein
MRFILPLLLAAIVVPGRPLAAQITVIPVRDLAFGPVIVGVPTYVPPSHPVRSGEFRISGPSGSRVQVRFTLPNGLDGPAGATLPISFANNDAIHVSTGPGGVPATFNPKATRNIQLTGDDLLVFIGGTVSPTGNQPQGNYAGTITLTINVQ